MENITKSAVQYFKKNDVNNLDEMDVFFFLTDLKEKEMINWDIVIKEGFYSIFSGGIIIKVETLPTSLIGLITFIENMNKKL